MAECLVSQFHRFSVSGLMDIIPLLHGKGLLCDWDHPVVQILGDYIHSVGIFHMKTVSRDIL